MKDDTVIFSEGTSIDRVVGDITALHGCFLDVEPLVSSGGFLHVEDLEVVQEHHVLLLATNHNRTDGDFQGLGFLYSHVDQGKGELLGGGVGEREAGGASTRDDEVVGIGGDSGLVAGVAQVGLVGVAAELVEEPSIDAVSPPVLEAEASVFADVEWNELAREAAPFADGMAELVDEHVVREILDALFAAFQGSIAGDTITRQEAAQGDADAVTG